MIGKIIFGLFALSFLFLLFCAAVSLFRIPLSYTIGNLKARRISTLMSILGIGVVIAVMLSMLALQNGVMKATVSSGSKDNLLILRDGAEAELSSWVTKDAEHIIRTIPGIAKDSHGQPLVAPELIILFKLPRPGAPKGSNVTVRGVTPASFDIRPYLKIVEGRTFRPGSNELIVSRRLSNRFSNLHVGDAFVFGPQSWTIVGAFDANGTAFDSELWGDAGYIGQVRHRNAYSSVLAKAADSHAFDQVKSAIENDNRLKLKVRSELQYYTDQTQGLLGIKILVGIVTFFMILGAILGTTNTMFSAIAPRQRELATLRALGFNRRTVIGTVVLESAIVALCGAVAGLLLSLPVNGLSTGTTNWSTFSEVAFSFRVDAGVAMIGFIVAFVAGIYGGAIPAIRMARQPITTALREI
jgi:ABC-type lipoprotein release transport system permease subunit